MVDGRRFLLYPHTLRRYLLPFATMGAQTDKVPNELLLEILRLATDAPLGSVIQLPPPNAASLQAKRSVSLVSRRFHELSERFLWEHLRLHLDDDGERALNDGFFARASPHVVHIHCTVVPSTLSDLCQRQVDALMRRSPRLLAVTVVVIGVAKVGSAIVTGMERVERLMHNLPDSLHFLHWEAATSARADAAVIPALGRLVSLRMLVLKFHKSTATPAFTSQYRRRYNAGTITLPHLRDLRITSPDVLVAYPQYCDLQLPQLTHWSTASDPVLFRRPGLCFPTVTHAHFTPFAPDMYPPEHVANPLQRLFPGLQYLSYVFEAIEDVSSDVNITHLLHAGLPPDLHTLRMVAASPCMLFYSVDALRQHLASIPFDTAPRLRYLELAGMSGCCDNVYRRYIRRNMASTFYNFAVRLSKESHPLLKCRFV